MTISEAVEALNDLNPSRYPIKPQTADTIRQACRRGKIEGARQTRTKRWIVSWEKLLEWANNPDMHKKGPKMKK